MSMKKFQVILPIISLIIAVMLMIAASYSRTPIIVDFPYPPTAKLVCKGLNAPAALVSVFVLRAIDSFRLNRAAKFGLAYDDLVFLLLVVLLWYLLGWYIDNSRRKAYSLRSWRRTLFSIVVGVFAIALLVVGATPLLDKGPVLNPLGTNLSSGLYFAWAALLSFLVWRQFAEGFHISS
jgi:hypothetical protein